MANEENTVLITGATGTVGREAVLAAKARGATVRALVRSADSAAQLPASVEAVLGDLRDERAVARALSGVRAALYVSPHEPDEVQLAERFVSACEAARVRLVFVGVHVDGATRFSRALKRFMYARLVPHYRAKFEIAERARTSRTNPIVLVPSNFYQNDELIKHAILRGSFPTAFERGVNRVDVRDLGVAIARALLDPELASGAYPVRGPVTLTGDACAEIWTRVMGKEVRCVRDMQQLVAALAPVHEKKREDFMNTFKVLQNFALPTTAAELACTRELIGREPTSYESYVRDALAQWRALREPVARVG